MDLHQKLCNGYFMCYSTRVFWYCLLFYSYADKFKYENFIREMSNEQERQQAQIKLNQIGFIIKFRIKYMNYVNKQEFQKIK